MPEIALKRKRGLREWGCVKGVKETGLQVSGCSEVTGQPSPNHTLCPKVKPR